MDAVRLLADRFVVGRGLPAVDLATGRPVVLKIGMGGGPSEQVRWAARCDWLHRLRHRALAPLIDYGALGESSRFEAWDCGPRWHGSGAEAERLRRSAARFLRACELTDGGPAAADVYQRGGRAAAVVPSDAAGYARAAGADVRAPGADVLSLDDAGIVVDRRRVDAAVVDLFASIDSLAALRPHVMTIWGPRGSGQTTAVLETARIARMRGFVPVAVPRLDRLCQALLSDRHICFISRDGGGREWRALLRAALESPRVHVLVRITGDEAGTMDSWTVGNLQLAPIPSRSLVAAVQPGGTCRAHLHRIARAATLATGRPGRFAELLWSQPAHRPSAERTRRYWFANRGAVARVAERSPSYASGNGGEVHAPAACVGAGPLSGDLAAMRRRSERAADLLRGGRHAPGVRQCRQAIGALSRREDWGHAGAASLALASGLLARGDPRAAHAALRDAAACAERTRNEDALADVAVLAAHAWIDLARLDEAESVAGAALAAARGMGARRRVAAASLALARCLFWKGQYAESASTLTSVMAEAVDPPSKALALAAAARSAAAAGDVARAMALLHEGSAAASPAAEGASTVASAASAGAVAAAAAFVRLVIGDVDAMARDVRAVIAAARAGHQPLQSIKARLLLAESDRRHGRAAAAASVVRRLHHAARTSAPPIVRARIELLRALLEPSCDKPADIAVRHARRTGLAALVLYGGGGRTAVETRPFIDSSDSSTDAVVDILRVCQTAGDEADVLRDVCARVRRQLHAAAVAILVRRGPLVDCIASDGARLEGDVAERAVSAQIAIAPHRRDDRIEAASPVLYGGSVIGAMAARWPIGTPYGLSTATQVLTMAASAAAPVVSAVASRPARHDSSATGELLGITPAMSELRRGIERAGPAPFAVLIAGESGSGKELVAKGVHRSGPRRDRPFCAVNCAALPDDLVEAELFGHSRGAFSGAVNERAGVFEEAHSGTLFLDEVGELSARAQAKLLRVIQEGELRRIGENLPRRVDVRIVAATNRDLSQESAAGRFRLDLYYRLDVIRLTVPPLRDRREDIPVLAGHFWHESTGRVGSRAVLAAATVAALARHDWPGNVRELQNVLAALAVRSPRRGVVPPSALPPPFGESPAKEACRLDDARRTFEERFVRATLVRTGGHRGHAAAELGVTRQGLTKLMTRLGIGDRAAGDGTA